MIVDAHLDLAYGALELGRDLTLPLEEIRKRDPGTMGIPTVTLPALREGGVALVFATLFAPPEKCPDPEMAHRAALAQLDVYRRWQEAGWVRLVTNQAELEAHLKAWESDRVTGLVVLMEGAEPVREPKEVSFWAEQGVRLIGPSWNRTRYAGGTREPGGLTELGRELLAAMKESRLALDLSHMDEQAVVEAFELWRGPLCATHSNARALLGGSELPLANRHLGDETIRTIALRGGIVGVVLYNLFLDPAWSRGMARVPLRVVQTHLEHNAGLVGWEHLGIGSDFDGGFGRDENPEGLDQPSDLAKIGNLLPEGARAGVLGKNWLRWLSSWL
jgi:membrane dipeptidase